MYSRSMYCSNSSSMSSEGESDKDKGEMEGREGWICTERRDGGWLKEKVNYGARGRGMERERGGRYE